MSRTTTPPNPSQTPHSVGNESHGVQIFSLLRSLGNTYDVQDAKSDVEDHDTAQSVANAALSWE
jgi:hypothetical protein